MLPNRRHLAGSGTGGSRRSLFWLVLVWLAGPAAVAQETGTAPSAPGIPLRVVLRAGEGFDFFLSNEQPLAFQQVDERGRTSAIAIAWTDIGSLVLLNSSDLEKLASVNRLIENLNSADWKVREDCEAALRPLMQRPDTGNLVLDALRSSDSLELRYRAARLLGQRPAASGSPRQGWRYDSLVLRDGTRRFGQANMDFLEGTRAGRMLKIPRDQVASISRIDFPADGAAESAPEVHVRMEHAPSFPAGSRLFDFQTGAGGQTLGVGTGLQQEFLADGLVMDAEFAPEFSRSGGMVVSSYSFSYADKPAGGNSICVSRDANSLVRPHQGVALLQFCRPGEALAPAGVRHFGIYAARVEYPMAILVQAINDDGHLLAEVQATDDRCSWFGVDSSEPVAMIRVTSNPLALPMDLRVDEDYALDHLCISRPDPVLPLESQNAGSVALRNGDILSATGIVPSSAGLMVQEAGGKPGWSNFAWDSVRWWIQPNGGFGRPTHETGAWFGLMDDRSFLQVEWNDGGLVRKLDGRPIDMNRLAAIWSARDWLRYPCEDDFLAGARVLVFPAGRLAVSSLGMDEQGFHWPREDAVPLLQPLMVSRQAALPADVTGANLFPFPQLIPTFRSVAWNSDLAWNVPSVWFRPPPARNLRHGLVSRRNGEQFVFGDGAEFQMLERTNQELRLRDRNGEVIPIPWEEVWRAVWPDGS